MTNADRARILAEARETLERVGRLLAKPYQPPPGPPPPADDDELAWPDDAPQKRGARILTSCDAMNAWRRDGEERKAAEEAETERRRTATWLQRSNAAVEQLDDRIAAEREFTSDVLIKLTARFNAQVSELRAELSKLRDELQALRAEHQQERELAYWTQHFASAGGHESKSKVALPLRRVS
jgi:hypothetical protein